MSILARSLIGSRDGTPEGTGFRAVNPATGESLDPQFHSANIEDVRLAAQLAADAFPVYANLSGRARASFLRAIAAKLESIAGSLVERAARETALPLPRLQGEVGRTCGQLRLFAQVAEEGSWVMARIDRAAPDRQPAPKPDIRSMLRPLGPVVVFGASNFPLAFSVAGGDTASALAAGNPVIVKAHPAHPGTSALVGQAIRESIRESSLPEGVFSLLFDAGTSVGTQLVQHALVKAVGFTGSQAAGRILFDLAVRRAEPIPFFGEMASTNPLFLLPGALAAHGEKIAADLYGSFTMGAGQFCTKPGLLFLGAGAPSANFLKVLEEKVSSATGFTLLTSGIASSYARQTASREQGAKAKLVARGTAAQSTIPAAASAALFQTDISTFLDDPNLAEEHFGPSLLVIPYSHKQQLLDCARSLSGHLTATIHGTPEDLEEHAELVRVLETKVGRIVFNGLPTGVEVNHAMVHGGPYPASTDSRATSVGSLAIYRFARPVCYQNFPDEALPEELKNHNPLRIWRLVDGESTKEPS
ncbi:MAG TPA: aldehyde dehydrogenase (NADP(+)) [Candidatus Saccharimonadales bacterium]|nr:aldehyde dehydrogenase (NADP(+)) [Candidatus Saccharimonadales bacterium]